MSCFTSSIHMLCFTFRENLDSCSAEARELQGCVFSIIPADGMSALAAMSPLGVILNPYPQHYTNVI